jgi:DNA replication protein DnaC
MKEILQRINRLREAGLVGSTRDEEKNYECDRCKDEEGYIVKDENGYEKWRWCEWCHEKKKIRRLFKFSRITEEFQRLDFHNFTLEGRPSLVHQAYECAKAYVEDFKEIEKTRKNSIALLGVPGCGKTHLLMAISNNLMRKGVGVLYFPWVEGFNELKDNLGDLDDRVRHMQRVPVLFIDDLFKGRKNPTDFQLEQLFAIINYRYLNHLPILVSSERDIDQICDIDEGIGSRIYEMCKHYTVVLRGQPNLNYRLEDEEWSE